MEEELLNGKTLLVVDDEVDLRDIMASEMEFMGAKVFQAGNITAAKEVLSKEQFDLIISDIRMPGGTGVDLLDHVKAINVQSPPVILITGFADITLEDAFNKGAEALLSKPFKLDDLIKTAAKNTLPVESRFKDTEITGTQNLEIDFGTDLASAMGARDFLIGRGGFALGLSTQRKKIEMNQVVNFDFKFTDHHFKGSAICRWVKMQEANHKVSVGFEFINLDRPFLDFLLGHWKQHLAVTYIPIP